MLLTDSTKGKRDMSEVKLLKQKIKGFLFRITKAINRTQSYPDGNYIDEKELHVLKENIEFAHFKLKSVTEQICSRNTLKSF